MPKRTVQNLRVGAFVAIALMVLIAAIFTIGQERSMFTAKTQLWTSFSDINGLVVGAPVRLAGVDVGRVAAISFSSDLSQPDARIELVVENRYMDRVRSDSRAYIDSKGLLGDKIINLSVGSATAARLNAGQYVQPTPGLSFESLAKQVENTASAIGEAAQKTGGAVTAIASPEVTADLHRIADSLASILDGVAKGDGLAHALVYDPSYARNASATLANLAEASAKARSAAGRIDNIVARVESGPGSLNTLVYGTEGGEALQELRRAAVGFAELSDQLNHGQGLVPSLLHDQAGQELVANVNQFAKRLNRITSDVEQGRGTIGGLLVDPTVYEDMKTVLGNIERNVVFKALVRMTIKQDGMQRPAKEARPGSGL